MNVRYAIQIVVGMILTPSMVNRGVVEENEERGGVECATVTVWTKR